MKRLLTLGMLFLVSSTCFALDGAGVQGNPYLIGSVADLDEFADENNAGMFWGSGVYVQLTVNIDLEGRVYDRAVIAPDEYATSTVNSYEGTVYGGVFDGAGHAICNLTIQGTGNDYVGLFGKVDGATAEIFNLSLVDVNISGRWHVGAMAGQNGGTVSDCYETGAVGGYEWYGGLIGINNGTVTGCHAGGRMDGIGGLHYVGGLIGKNTGSVSDCSSTGSSRISGDLSYVGGLIGWNVRGSVSRCYSDLSVAGVGGMGGLIGVNEYGRISRCHSTAEWVNASEAAGGLIGWNNEGVVSECYSAGEVEGIYYIGGLIGDNYDGTVNDCFSVCSVRGGQACAGGLVGRHVKGVLSNCFSTGSVKGWNRVGGLVGQDSNSSVRYCYAASDVYGRDFIGGLVGYDGGGCSYVADFWDSTVNGSLTGIGTSSDPSGVVGTATSNLRRSGVYAAAGWDFAGKWWIHDDVDTPQLRWRKTSTKTPQIVLFDGQVYGSDSFGLHLDPGEGSTWTIQESCDWLEVTPASGTAGASAEITVSTTASLPAAGYHECRLEVSSDGAGSEVEYVTVVLHVMYAGDGSAGNPFEIGTAEELELMGRRPMDWDKHFVMTDNIDLANRYYDEALIAGGYFNYDQLTFTGAFDGSGHTISNLMSGTYGNHYVGLFGFVDSGAVISNLGLVDVAISGRQYVGALAGRNRGTVTNCYSTGNIRYVSATRGNYLGGLCGWNESGTIMQSYSTVDISCTYFASHVGGLCGKNGSSETGPGNIYGCYAMGSIEVGDESNTVGGLCGGNAASSTIIGCYATGSVKGGKESYGLGGLCGGNGEDSIIRNCYARGAVEAGDDSSGVGGLCADSGVGTIDNCYSTGSVKVGVDCNSVGGLVGSGGMVRQSFWDIETCGPNYNNLLGTPKTTDEMQTLSTFVSVGWDFSDDDGDPAIWEMPAVKGYPLLIWGVIGVELEVVPDLISLWQAEAEAAILSSGFSVGAVTSANSSSVPVGHVMGQSPSAGGLLLIGSAIDLVISTGPQLVSAPDLTGMTEAEAADALTSLGLTLGIVASEYHPTAPAGTVFTQEAGPGTILAVGSPVDIIVSLGWIVLPGQGIEDDPYMISSGVEFQIFADERSAGQYWGSGVYTSLANDLDLSGISPGMIGYPIAFDGVFDGGNHVITNLRDTDHGLFNIGPDGIVRNIRLEDVEIVSSGGYTGAVAASNQGLIRNCCVSGTVVAGAAGVNYTGGICGSNAGGTIEECYWSGDVVGRYDVGGIVGYNGWHEIRPGQWSSGTVRDCAASGSVKGSSSIGGLVGCNYAEITMCYSIANVKGGDIVGGLVGSLYGNDWAGKVLDCYAAGDPNGLSKVGGLIGEMSFNFQYGSNPPVARSYSTGRVSGTADAGGLIGYNGYGAISDCFWDVEMSGQASSSNGGGIGKTSEQMEDPSTFTDAGWDFTKPVWMISGVDYPRLVWREPDVDDNGKVDFDDLAQIAKYWLQDDCGLCSNSDLTGDLRIDYYDLQIIADNWLGGAMISDHVSMIEMVAGYFYGKDGAPAGTYGFNLSVYTDDRIAKVEFLAPSGNLFVIPADEYMESVSDDGYIETKHTCGDEGTDEEGLCEWRYEISMNDPAGFAEYGDGWYTFTFYFGNGRTETTEVFFGDSATGQPLPQPTQQPVLLSPGQGATVSSPVVLQWQECVDPYASVIHIYADNDVLDDEVETDGLLGRDVTAWGPLSLGAGVWVGEITFAAVDFSRNGDGIDTVAVKASSGEYSFEVVP
jgi:hypothetical protein